MLLRLDANTAVDAYSLPQALGCTPADRAWNRLKEAGCRWQALSDLEHALGELLSGQNGGDAGPLLDAFSDGVVAVDLTGRITLANSIMAAICGVENRERLLGLTLEEALGSPETAKPLQGAATMAQLATDVKLASASGPERILRCSRRIRFSGLEPAGFVWTIRDVTQQRLAEAMRDRFLAIATHEFRTPLANIRAYAESLDLGLDLDPESRKQFYNIIQSESLRLSQLVDDLLDISRMQAGSLALDRHETDLGRLVEEATSKVQAQMREKELRFRCEIPPKFPKAIVDKSKLTAALVNLLGNAAKYTPPGGEVTFRVEVAAQTRKFSVSDTGIGISAEELPRVFERFYRSADERVRGITGSGLGLALTQEISRLHGGDVVVESTLNQGAPADQLRECARRQGCRLLSEHAIRLAEDGLTSLDEILRVAHFD